MVEELLDLFGIDPVLDHKQSQPVETAMAISKHALTGDKSTKAFQVHAWLQGHEILMLVDSSSSTSFVDAHLAAKLEGVVPLARAGRVKVAGGGELQCRASIPQCKWFSQGHEFVTDMKVLELGTYAAIFGMDWLEQNSPMTVDWKGKHIAIPSPGGVVHIHGHPSTSSCPVINSMQLGSLCRQGAVSHMVQLYQVTLGDREAQEATLECIQAILEQYPDVFQEPEGLPPRRNCDHHIPLVPGAQPVNIRPYRHKPEHKTEIEEQVVELLKQGVIRRSASPFASPVILVKKEGRHMAPLRRLSPSQCYDHSAQISSTSN